LISYAAFALQIESVSSGDKQLADDFAVVGHFPASVVCVMINPYDDFRLLACNRHRAVTTTIANNYEAQANARSHVLHARILQRVYIYIYIYTDRQREKDDPVLFRSLISRTCSERSSHTRKLYNVNGTYRRRRKKRICLRSSVLRVRTLFVYDVHTHTRVRTSRARLLLIVRTSDVSRLLFVRASVCVCVWSTESECALRCVENYFDENEIPVVKPTVRTRVCSMPVEREKRSRETAFVTIVLRLFVIYYRFARVTQNEPTKRCRNDISYVPL